MASLNNKDGPNDNSNLNMSPAAVQQQQQQRCRKLAIPIYSRYAAALVSPVPSFAYHVTRIFVDLRLEWMILIRSNGLD